MSGQIGALMKAGVAFKLAQVKQAASAYVEDRTDHGKSVVAGYAVAAGLYAAAGIFLIAACLVGVAALFHWLELQYGMFPALAICAGVLIALTLLCALIAASRLNARPPSYPSLSARLGAALKGQSLKSPAAGVKAVVQKTAATTASLQKAPAVKTTPKAAAPRSAVATPPAPRDSAIRSARKMAENVLRRPASPNRYDSGLRASATKTGLALGAGLLGWAMVRRRRNEFAQAAPKR